MSRPRLLPFLMLTLLAALVSACGSDGGDTSSSESRDAGTAASEQSDADTGADAGSDTDSDADADAAAKAEQAIETASFAVTPELASCMKTAGLTQDATPVEGAVASWSGAGGARVAVAPSSDTALMLAGTIGTDKLPASVDGSHVSVGPAATVGAAQKCLDA